MSRLVVLAFDSETGMEGIHRALAGLRRQHLIHLAEPAIVACREDGLVTVKPPVGLAGPAALFGAFWGVMVGLLFGMPWLGLGCGAAAGALIGAIADERPQDPFVREVGHSLKPGHLALLLLAHDWADDRQLAREVNRYDGVLLPLSKNRL